MSLGEKPDELDAFIESAVVGIRKPDPRIYEYACRELGIVPEHSEALELSARLKALAGDSVAAVDTVELLADTEQDPEKPNPTFIEVANEAAQFLADKHDGVAQSMILEATANIPTTAHILGDHAVAYFSIEDGKKIRSYQSSATSSRETSSPRPWICWWVSPLSPSGWGGSHRCRRKPAPTGPCWRTSPAVTSAMMTARRRRARSSR